MSSTKADKETNKAGISLVGQYWGKLKAILGKSGLSMHIHTGHIVETNHKVKTIEIHVNSRLCTNTLRSLSSIIAHSLQSFFLRTTGYKRVIGLLLAAILLLQSSAKTKVTQSSHQPNTPLSQVIHTSFTHHSQVLN